MSRLLLVSNRLPVSIQTKDHQVQITPSVGGLATGLQGPHQRMNGLWLGWPGELSRIPVESHAEIARRLAELRLVPLMAHPKEFNRFYEGFSNSVLWPLFHYMLDRVHLESKDWDSYVRINQSFAALVVQHYRPGDIIWIHDYHLCLLPSLIRAQLPEARIGFFLHIPFPSSEVFRILPWRAAILQGMLGADLIGFHSFSYTRHFFSSIQRILGLEAEVDCVWYQGREIRVESFPMGVDAKGFDAMSSTPEALAESDKIRQAAGDRRILLGVDRLDYTKGMPRRLQALERFLEREPTWRDKVRFIQIAVPSRTQIDTYEAIRQKVDGLVGRINGAYGSPSAVPIHYIYRDFPQEQIATFYRAADVMLVTPLRDGMNLVAKEFAASRSDLDGVLLLSEFAGAAAELGGGAILLNPYDIEQVANSIKQALTMPQQERRDRMLLLRERIFSDDVHHWAESFLHELGQAPSTTTTADQRLTALHSLKGSSRVLLLDYDGTLVPFTKSPEQAAPDKPLLELLSALARAPETELHMVSGRSKEMLERWFSHLPIHLHAEHGLWSRFLPDGEWRLNQEIKSGWKEKVLGILQRFTVRTPGSFIEEKSASLTWHFRASDVEFGALQARELRLHLLEVFSNTPIEVLHGERIVEIRQQGVHKGIIVQSLLSKINPTTRILAMGDDRTDEDMFAALPPGSIAVHVGPRPSRAAIRVADYTDTRALLRSLL
jgi:trehalose 6-phosphate synthase/phosphatase